MNAQSLPDSTSAAGETAAATQARAKNPLAVASIILSAGLTAIGNGLMFSYIPVSLGAAGYPPTWAGWILTSLAIGGMIACFGTGLVVRRVGHARAFMLFSAMLVLSNAGVGVGVSPVAWLFARALYGFAIGGFFIVAQSWLNDAVENRVRGRTMAAFYVVYIVGLGCGSLVMGVLDLTVAASAPLTAIVTTALAMIPMGLTRLPQPAPPASASVALRRAWQISPVGIAGMLAAGGLSMMIAGFAPIHATASGYSQQEVALLLFAMPLGTLFVQIPLGWISDRTDRRLVLVAASIMVALGGVTAGIFDGSALVTMIVIYMVWDGASESIYALATAHAGDRAGGDDMVMMQSTLLFAWSFAGFIVPGVGTILTGMVGTIAFIWIAVAIAVAYAVFVIWRIAAARPVPAAETGSFAPMSAQAALPVELSISSPSGNT